MIKCIRTYIRFFFELLFNDSIFEILSLLYSNTEFKSAIIKDLIFAVLFTVLGVSGIFKTLKNQAKNGEELTLKKTSKEENVSKEESKEEK